MSKTSVFNRVLNDSNDLTRETIKRIIDGDLNKLNDEIVDDVIKEMEDVIKHGCESGCCSPFIYTQDNINFLKQNLEDVFDLLTELQYNYHELDDAYDVNKMTWFVVEYCLGDFIENYNYLIEYDEE